MVGRWTEPFCNQIEVIISSGGKTAKGRNCNEVIWQLLITSVEQWFSNLFLAVE